MKHYIDSCQFGLDVSKWNFESFTIDRYDKYSSGDQR